MRINNYAIKLVDDWQLLCDPIYSLELAELKTLKTFIKNNLTNAFIKPSKFLAGALNFFHKKIDKSLRLCVDY